MTEAQKKSWGSGGFFGNRALGSLFLMLMTPVFCLTFWYTCYHHNGSFLSLLAELKTADPKTMLFRIMPIPNNLRVWKLIFSYMAFEIFLMKVVPGKRFVSTVTPSGHLPVYKANGMQCYVITIITLLALYKFDIFNPAEVYDVMGVFLSSMNVFAIIFCIFLTIKGLTFPSTADSGSSGNLIVDYFWGTELYPRVFGVDIKQFTNCRFGMMFWQVGIICYAIKQYELYGFVSSSMAVSVLVQSVYIAKFFWWETGYFCSMDIQHDRAGYYICWGCLVWVPSMYTIHTYFMVNHPVQLSLPLAAVFAFAGIFSIWVNYDCDRLVFFFLVMIICILIIFYYDILAVNVKSSVLPMEELRFGVVNQP